MAVNEATSSCDAIKKAVDELFYFRDHYFEKFGIEQAGQKSTDVEQKMKDTYEKVEAEKDLFKNKSEYFLLLGRTLNVTDQYDTKAEEYLSKAVKLDPKLVEAWNQLGEVYWKKGDMNNAKNCLTGALAHSRNKHSLRALSMVLRQLPDVPDDRRSKNITESVDMAKEAVQMDITDGESWLILANAYLSLFFIKGQNPKILSQAMSAYKQAEKDPVAKNNADLHFNRSSVYLYQENYQAALEGFALTIKLDPCFTIANLQELKVLDYLSRVTEMVEEKGKVKGKRRLQTLARSPRDSALGPYAGGSYTNFAGKKTKLMRCSFKDLEPELNEEKVVLGKVVCTVATEDLVPFTFCLLDEDETCLPVTVYNIVKGYGVKIGDAVAIPEPFIQEVKVNYKSHSFNYKNIRVSTPTVLVVNGRRIGNDKEAGTVLVLNGIADSDVMNQHQ